MPDFFIADENLDFLGFELETLLGLLCSEGSLRDFQTLDLLEVNLGNR